MRVVTPLAFHYRDHTIRVLRGMSGQLMLLVNDLEAVTDLDQEVYLTIDTQDGQAIEIDNLLTVDNIQSSSTPSGSFVSVIRSVYDNLKNISKVIDELPADVPVQIDDNIQTTSIVTEQVAQVCQSTTVTVTNITPVPQSTEYVGQALARAQARVRAVNNTTPSTPQPVQSTDRIRKREARDQLLRKAHQIRIFGNLYNVPHN